MLRSLGAGRDSRDYRSNRYSAGGQDFVVNDRRSDYGQDDDDDGYGDDDDFDLDDRSYNYNFFNRQGKTTAKGEELPTPPKVH